MTSREGFPQAGGPDGVSPPAVASDRAAKAYEKAFLESANSNESKIRLLEERMKPPRVRFQSNKRMMSIRIWRLLKWVN